MHVRFSLADQPFKDNVNNLGVGTSFQGARAAALGASLLDALSHVAPSLRGVVEPAFPGEDAYIEPVEDEKAVAAFVAAQKAAFVSESGTAQPSHKRQRG